ncbi:MAG: hypothetical protein E7254_12040 [Lachnospiraceae bacterium]|nr:hypothetical protein [Lachnospiraceae bacterium]
MKKYIIVSCAACMLFLSTVAITQAFFKPNPEVIFNNEDVAVNRVVISDEILAKANERILAGKAPEAETVNYKKLSKIEKFRYKVSQLSIADMAKSDKEALTIFKKADKKSKIKGYLPDCATMTVVEKGKEWSKIKSGKIEGFVRSKYIMSGKKVEDAIIDNNFVSATITEDSVAILSKSKKDSSAVGMGYKGKEYPILGFSDNDKYAYIERTETISGWIPIADIKINLTAPKAMTASEYEDYETELELAEEAALNSYMSIKFTSTGNKLQDSIITLISHNESGNYKAARNPITSGEKTITVGAWQWYGENAHNILRLICSANYDKAKSILEDAFMGKKAKENSKKLYKDIIGHDNWVTDERIFTRAELIAIKELLGSDQGVKVQNQKIQADIQAKARVAINSYSIKDDGIVAYFCDLFWQNPANARKIIQKCIKHYGSAKKFCNADDGLKYFHETAMKNNVMNKYSRRRNYTYAFCKKLR